MGLCNHRSRGDRTSISVWCSHVSATPEYGNQVRTHCQVTTAPEKKRKKAKKPLIGVVCLLTTGVLISVRGFGGYAATHAEGTGPDRAFLARLAGRPWVVVTVPALV